MALTRRTRIKAGIANGLSDDDIAESLGLAVEDIIEEREQIYLEELERYADTQSTSFVNFSIFISSKIAKLDELMESFYDADGVIKAAAANAAVSAIKLQGEMYERVLKKAEEYRLLTAGDGDDDESIEGLTGTELISKIRAKMNSLDALIGETERGDAVVKPPPGVKRDSYVIRPKRAAKPLPRSEDEGK